MACSRCLLGPLAILALAALVASTASTALAQAGRSLPSDIITAQELSSEQRDRVVQYASHWCERMLAQRDADVSEAQRRLTEPLRSPAGPSPRFLEAYSEPLVDGLARCLAADERTHVRLNAMIVVAYMPPAPAIELIGQGVEDENPAVRYWALKSVQQIANRHGWSNGQQLELLEMLTEVLRQEQATVVVRQVMLGLVGLDVRDAMEQTLEALNERADAHEASPGQALAPELTGLEQLFRRLIEAEDAAAASRDLRELSRTAYRYIRLAAVSLNDGSVASEYAATYRSLILLADQILHEAHSELDGGQNPPPRVGSDVQNEDWSQVLDKAQQWGALLQEPPFNFTAGELALAPADE